MIEFRPTDDPCWRKYPEKMSDVDEVMVFDTETTGIDFHDDRVVTAHVSTLKRGSTAPTGPLDLIIDAGVDSSEQAIAVHGITNERRAAEGITELSGVRQIIDALNAGINAGIPLVAYNGTFDFTMIHEASVRLGVEPPPLERAVVLDPLVIDKVLFKYRRGSRKLVDVARIYGVPFDNAHEASADAVGAGRVLFVQLDHPALASGTTRLMPAQQQAYFAEQSDSLEKYLVNKNGAPLDKPINRSWLVAS